MAGPSEALRAARAELAAATAGLEDAAIADAMDGATGHAMGLAWARLELAGEAVARATAADADRSRELRGVEAALAAVGDQRKAQSRDSLVAG